MKLIQFKAKLAELSKKLDIKMSSVVKKVVFDIHKHVTDLSPVDTGRFRASWGISQRKIPDDPGAPAGKNIPASAAQVRVNYGKERSYSVWFIYNNLSYARKLETGSSKQAPYGVARMAMIKERAEIAYLLDRIM